MDSLILQESQRVENLYRDLHAHPELSGGEVKTAERMARELEEIGLPVTRSVGGTGVVGLLENGAGPKVLVRADMDALPVTEATGLSYASQVKGVAHVCGHDLHMACLIGTARILSRMKKDWAGTLIFIAQPAEEKGEGAQAMLKDGLFQRFSKPDFALALHVDSQLPAGSIGYRSGPALANVDSVDILIHGRGGHGAYPHLAVDPIVMASEVVLALQTIASREVKPSETAVVTVGSFHGGTKHNIIPGEVRLELTVRSYSDEVREQILESIRRIATGVARAHRSPRDPEVKVSESIPSTYNDPSLATRLVPVFKKVFGESRVIEKEPEMGGEDFGLFGRAGVPAFLFRLGSVPPERMAESRKPGAKPLPTLHSSEYAPDLQPTLQAGIRAMTAAVLELTGKAEKSR